MINELRESMPTSAHDESEKKKKTVTRRRVRKPAAVDTSISSNGSIAPDTPDAQVASARQVDVSDVAPNGAQPAATMNENRSRVRGRRPPKPTNRKPAETVVEDQRDRPPANRRPHTARSVDRRIVEQRSTANQSKTESEPRDKTDRHPVRGDAPRDRKRSKQTNRDQRRDRPAPAVELEDDDLSTFDQDDREEKPRPSGKGRIMLINVSGGDECRIAVIAQKRLEELFLERASSQSHVGNIYKGRVVNVEPGIQAAFVDFGLHKNGFLHISDVQPQYFPRYGGDLEEVGRKIPRRDRPTIQDCFRRGQEVIVQVIKEGVGTKGPTLTTYLSIPGRFLVMMPGMAGTGVSRKIEDDAERQSMRQLLDQLKLPPDIGFIMRTAGSGQSKRDLQRDLNYLLRLWRNVITRVKSEPAPAELYQESDLITRTIRDLYTPDFDRIIIDDAESAERAREFLQIAVPRSKVIVELYSDREPLFHRFNVEAEIERINLRAVPLPSGGSLVIDSTEAMVAIDVNSGRFRAAADAEELAYRTNMEAADEIARQLRLRDLGGLIVCDFIDMRFDRHKRAVERQLRDALKEHKERARILRMSAFGLIEMTRQRRGPAVNRSSYFECLHCKGTGLVKLPESVVLDVIRTIQLATNRDPVRTITVTVSPDVAYQILNRKRSLLGQIESDTGKEIMIRGEPGFTSDQVSYVLHDAQGHPIPFPAADASRATR